MPLCWVSLQLFSVGLLVHFEMMATNIAQILMELRLIDVEQQLVFLNLLQHRNKRGHRRRWSVRWRRRRRSHEWALPSWSIGQSVEAYLHTKLYWNAFNILDLLQTQRRANQSRNNIYQTNCSLLLISVHILSSDFVIYNCRIWSGMV